MGIIWTIIIGFLAGVIAALSRRPILDKLLVFAAAPVAGILANILRVSATIEAGVLGYNADFVAKVHDVGGYLLAPAALMMLLSVIWIVALVFPTLKPADEPLQIAFQLGVADQSHYVAPSRKRTVEKSRPAPFTDVSPNER